MDARKLSDVIAVDEDVLFIRAGRSNYWKDVAAFWDQNKDRYWISLSDAQKEWARKIAASLEAEVAR